MMRLLNLKFPPYKTFHHYISLLVAQAFISFQTDNDIDGTTLAYLMNDRTEFITVVPKASHRLYLKDTVEKMEGQTTEVAVQPAVSA